MKKICLISTYFGEFPPWFPIFAKTCQYNPDIKWLIITDQGEFKEKVDNLEIIYFSRDEFTQLLMQKTGLTLSLKSPKKMGDFKPLYGLIFEDYLKNYDFWGHVDIDLIYGNIKEFIKDEYLENFDIIIPRDNVLTGHFTLFRNESWLNCLFKKSRDYKDVLESETIFYFDEKNDSIDSMDQVVKREMVKNNIRTFSRKMILSDKMKLRENWKICWDNGRLFDLLTGQEIMYFHFITLKNDLSFRIPNWEKVPEKFYLTREGFCT